MAPKMMSPRPLRVRLRFARFEDHCDFLSVQVRPILVKETDTFAREPTSVKNVFPCNCLAAVNAPAETFIRPKRMSTPLDAGDTLYQGSDDLVATDEDASALLLL